MAKLIAHLWALLFTSVVTFYCFGSELQGGPHFCLPTSKLLTFYFLPQHLFTVVNCAERSITFTLDVLSQCSQVLCALCFCKP